MEKSHTLHQKMTQYIQMYVSILCSSTHVLPFTLSLIPEDAIILMEITLQLTFLRIALRPHPLGIWELH